MKLKDWLVPREGRFFDLLEEQSKVVVDGVQVLHSLLSGGEDPREARRRLKEFEHRGDLVVHSIFEALNQTFITPIDREDIARLASSLDDVLDHADAVANMYLLYEVPATTKELASLSVILTDQVRILDECLRQLRDTGARGAIRARLVEIHALENRADDTTNQAIAELFRHDDVKTILKMKEMYEFLEAATDRCEDAADVIRDVLVKYD